ncbi:connectin-like [Achroia grisella]|uniref:connectin-like n=1 Tax=Achroia grisella TaxID=688607 RepID=UPI0027D34D78|nr:connectin-like [Achroia grisella]
MESVVQYLLLALVLTSVQISYTESRLTQRRDKSERRYHAGKNKDNVCEITDRASKVHCYCENTEIKSARRADCWVFNGGIEESDPIWSSFNSQPFLERLAFNVRSDGALKFIPLQVIHHLKRLQKLSIHYATFNKIEKRIFYNMTTVREIILMNNKITDLDFSSFANLPLLVNLTIKENKITEIQKDVFVDLPSLKNLDLSFNNIHLVHDGCFGHLTTLSDLTLEANSINTLTKDTFRGLANLTRLDLRSNKLSAIEDLTFTELWNLNELLLDNNELKYLSERAFDGLALLQKLSMTGNKLTAINEGLLEGVRGLELLDLRNNGIVTFTYDTIKPIMENLKVKTSVLYLSGNKLRCDCRLIWIQVLRNETASEPLKAALDDVTCIIDADEADSTKNIEYNNGNTKLDELFEIISNSNANSNEDEELNRLHKVETTTSTIISQLAVVNIPVESLRCASKLAQNSEDSLMLSSKDENYWKSSSNFKTCNLYLVSILLISSILY